MTRNPLPLVDPARTEFGYSRTVCACRECTLNCRHIPGYLIPDDLERICQQLAPGDDLFAWAKHHLLASPGAKLQYRGKILRIPTLVPARQPNGACVFLTPEGRCSVHAVAPFGCAFFDAHQHCTESDRRSLRGLQAVMEAWSTGARYALVWITLDQAGLRAPAPENCRQHLQQALDRERPL